MSSGDDVDGGAGGDDLDRALRAALVESLVDEAWLDNFRRELLPTLRERARADVVSEIRDLERAGMAPSELLDYWFVSVVGVDQAERAEMRGVSYQAVNQNVARARETLEDDERALFEAGAAEGERDHADDGAPGSDGPEEDGEAEDGA
jgi:hypothetical protein